jgi:hypothetical protein
MNTTDLMALKAVLSSLTKLLNTIDPTLLTETVKNSEFLGDPSNHLHNEALQKALELIKNDNP